MNGISKEGQRFLIDLNAYLMTKGVNEKEIKSFIEEAEAHLLEGEAAGKTVVQIFGKNCRTYADELAAEMTVSKKEIVSNVICFLLGATAFWLLGEALKGDVSFSWIVIFGYPAALLLGLALMVNSIRLSSFRSRWKGFSIIYLYAILGFAGFVIVLVADMYWGVPVVQLGGTGTVVTGVAAALMFTSISVYLKSWFMNLFPILYFGPQMLFKLWDLTSPLYQMLQVYISLALIGLAIFIMNKWLGNRPKRQ
ncbi:hypothetical protein PAECIP111893_00765 [Paenibacillus plantiphilus]|uniref:HAAS transmembrane region domain-containing protein n=1 Tax=Paenibacillus plantiphilus TaxID=2905650 RepID=A0ABM9BVL9_9BACL|nr:hypothetical protein [Paenibacillus plantiphilus]CAH1195835.1 hypothetical protein PAECIP111893_00765 [Paenibacillus plantiphilus]